MKHKKCSCIPNTRWVASKINTKWNIVV